MTAKLITRILLASAITFGGTAALIATAPETAAATKKKKTSARKKYDRYTGTVGKYKVTMFLDSDYNGYYYYGNGSKGKLIIKGTQGEVCGPACVTLLLKEYDAAGNQTAVWEVYLNGMTVSPGQRVWGITGEMTTGGKTYDVDLTLQ